MSCEVHVRFYERLGVRLPRPTHHVLDLWFQKKWRSHEVKGDTIIVRYADDFVVGFQHKQDAERFLDAVKERFGSFELELHPRQDPAHRVRAVCRERPSATRAGQTEDLRFSGLHALLHEDQTRVLSVGAQANRKADGAYPEVDNGGATQADAP